MTNVVRRTRRRALVGLLVTVAVIVALIAAYLRWIAPLPPDAFTRVYQGQRYQLVNPEMLAVLAGLPILVWIAMRSLADLAPIQRWISIFVRALVIAAAVLGLSRLVRTTDATRVAAVYLVDVSESVPDASLERARDVVQRAWDARGDGEVHLVTFARRPRVVDLPADTRRIPALARHTQPREAGAGTDVAAAMQLAYGLYPPGTLRRMVLLTDGIETQGDLLAEAERARRFGVRVSHHLFREGRPREVAVRELTVPDRIRVGDPFAVRARVFSSYATRARLRLYQGDTLNIDGVRDVELVAGDNDVSFRSVVHVPGTVTYRVEASNFEADRFAANNRYAITAVVPGRPSVLYVEGEPSRATYLARSLATGDYEVEVRGPREFPRSLSEIERFDFTILSDVPAEHLSPDQMLLVERYVRDLGGGFLMAGGPNSFGLGGYYRTRIERILPVRMDAERRNDQPSLALALVIDRSGSMSGIKIELAKEAARATAELLGPDDYLEVIGFHTTPERIVRMQSARNRLRIQRDIGRLAAGGGTAIAPAVDMAFQDLTVVRARTKHMILLSDGQDETAESILRDLVPLMQSEGITISVVGIGSDVNRSLMQQIADRGGGRAYFTQDASRIPRIFTRETETVARSSIVEEYFQPSVVSPADFLRGLPMGSAPFLHGFVATRAKPHPAQVVLMSDTGEPILARWRLGLGWSLAWTSDVKNRWAADWISWSAYNQFWSQLVREHMRQRRRTTLDMRAEIVDGRVRVVVDAVDDDDSFINGLDSRVTLDGPQGVRAAPRPSAGGGAARQGTNPENAPLHEEHVLAQTAPGRYEAEMPLDRYGSFVLQATHRREGRVVAESFAQLSNPYPREYAAREPDAGALMRLASLTRGRADPTPRQVFDPAGEKVQRNEDLWPWLLGLAIALFVLDLFLRRVRIFDRKFRTPARPT